MGTATSGLADFATVVGGGPRFVWRSSVGRRSAPVVSARMTAVRYSSVFKTSYDINRE